MFLVTFIYFAKVTWVCGKKTIWLSENKEKISPTTCVSHSPRQMTSIFLVRGPWAGCYSLALASVLASCWRTWHMYKPNYIPTGGTGPTCKWLTLARAGYMGSESPGWRRAAADRSIKLLVLFYPVSYIPKVNFYCHFFVLFVRFPPKGTWEGEEKHRNKRTSFRSCLVYKYIIVALLYNS